MVNVVRLSFTAPEFHDITNGVFNVLRFQGLFVLRNIGSELPVDPETAHFAESVPTFVKEAGIKEPLRFFQGFGGSGSEFSVQEQKGRFVVVHFMFFFDRLKFFAFFFECVQDQPIQAAFLTGFYDFDFVNVLAEDVFGGGGFDFITRFDDDLTGFGVVDRLDGHPVDQFFRFRVFVEGNGFGRRVVPANEIFIGGQFRLKGFQENGCGKLAALINSDPEKFLFRHLKLDPGSPIGHHPAGLKNRVSPFFFHEVNTGRPFELRHDDAFGSVYDKVSATEHYGHVTEVHVFLNGFLFAFKTKAYFEGNGMG